MKKYRIHVRYETGDSFRHYNAEMDIELTWDNLDIAKENLQRIKKHYEWYRDKHCHFFRHKPSLEKPDFVDDEYDFCLNLKTDEGKEHHYSASTWCDYFSTLYGASIVEEKDESLSFEV